MSLHFFETVKREKVEFKSIEPGLVKLYTCGPTVYADAHIGNFRTYMFEDLLRRTLEYLGYRVFQVMNLTDVDDKTIEEASVRDVPLGEVTEPIIARFMEDLEILGIKKAEVYPRATEHITEMQQLVSQLLETGYAYEANGSIYFRIENFPQYGALSGMKLDELKHGVRIESDEYEKGDFRDFALWKGWVEKDGDVAWDASFGRGRPGWHIECSAMSMKYLGEEFDIHTGGVDNIFPHHENEIAQSVAATGRGFVRYWLHSEHLIVEGEKMSKSLGNYYCLRDLLDKGYSPREIRYVLLGTHYRQRLNFTDESIQAAVSSLERLDSLRYSASEAIGNGGEGSCREALKKALDSTMHGFKAALEDDLNISRALAALFELVSNVNSISNQAALNSVEGTLIMDSWRDADSVLGFLIPDETGLPEDVVELVRERLRSRNSRNFTQADQIRDILISRGYRIEDIHGGKTIITGAEGREIVETSS